MFKDSKRKEMIELETGYIFDQGGICDYCNKGLEPGEYLGLTGYRVRLNIPEERKPNPNIPDVLIMEPPFIPCPECLIELGITEDTLIINPNKVQALHIKVANQFHGEWFSGSEPMPDPIVELIWED